LAGLVVGGIGLSKYLEEKNAGETYEELKEDFDIEPLVDIPTIEETVENPIDFKTLTAKYPDIYAWIRVPGTNIDYPIVQHPTDNSYYINHTIEGKKRIAGAIFTENYNSKDFNDPNTLIYGHNMKNGSMFGSLKLYRDYEYYKEHPVFYIYTDEGVYEYRIFSVRVVSAVGDAYVLTFESDEAYAEYLEKAFRTSMYDTDVESLTTEDKIVTLSTCTASDENRMIVQAVRGDKVR
jgi:sortase B